MNYSQQMFPRPLDRQGPHSYSIYTTQPIPKLNRKAKHKNIQSGWPSRCQAEAEHTRQQQLLHTRHAKQVQLPLLQCPRGAH